MRFFHSVFYGLFLSLLISTPSHAENFKRLGLENNSRNVEAIKGELTSLTPQDASLCLRARSAIRDTCEIHSVCSDKITFINSVPIGRGSLEDAFFINDVWKGIFEDGIESGDFELTQEDRKMLSDVGINPNSHMAKSLLVSLKMPKYDLESMKTDRNSFQTVLGFFENCKADLYNAAVKVHVGNLSEVEK